MSFQVDTAHVKQFNATAYMLLQQKGSRLRGCVRNETQNAEEQFWDQIGPVTAQEITTRHGDSPLISTPHDRRRVTLRFFVWGDLIDKIDKVRMLIDPASPYTQNGAYALGRSQDDVIIDALFGTAFTGKAGGTSITFPAGQVVAHNFGGANSGLTVPKLIEAKRLLMAANIDFDAEEIYLGCTSRGLADLLNTTQVTSREYSDVQALVEGKVTKFLGFNFKFSERFLKDAGGATYWRYPVWCKSGLLYTAGAEIESEIAKRPDKRFSWYAYLMQACGATRMEEEKVVEIRGSV